MVNLVQRILLLGAIGFILLVSFPVEAAPFCRHSGDHTICIVSIRRSAKNYWEYRAAVQIDGDERPVEMYNCRDRVRIDQTGRTIPFEPQGAGALICTVLAR